MRLTGVIPPMVTPVTGRNGAVDREALGEFVEFLVDGGAHGLFPCGSIGEFSSLEREQRNSTIETVSQHADGQPVLAGCGGTSVTEVERLIADAADVGADAAVVVTPYFLDTTQDGLRAFYERVAAEARLPIVLYDIPSLTGTHLTVDSVAQLAEQPNIVGIKDSTRDINYHYELITNTPDSFSVLNGFAELGINALDIGASGLVMGPANVFPTAHAELFDSYREGNRERSIELLNNVTLPVVSVMKGIPAACALKHLVSRSGHAVGEPLLPLPELTEREQERLDNCFDQVSNETESLGL